MKYTTFILLFYLFCILFIFISLLLLTNRNKPLPLPNIKQSNIMKRNLDTIQPQLTKGELTPFELAMEQEYNRYRTERADEIYEGDGGMDYSNDND